MIEVGEYIRTKKGYIEKINDFIPHYTKGKRLGKSEEVVENYLSMGAKQCQLIESIDYSIPPCYPSDEELEKIKTHIINNSKDILDIIQKGDFINGERVSEITKNYITIGKITYARKDLKGIKTILTKEQYEANCYKVKEEL